jgi:hypothetical protein
VQTNPKIAVRDIRPPGDRTRGRDASFQIQARLPRTQLDGSEWSSEIV